MVLSGGSVDTSDGDNYLSAAERARRSLAKQDQVRADGLTPDWFLRNRALGALCIPPTGVRVAVIGAGYAGLMAAWYLTQCGIDVTVYEAANQIGGRVQTDRSFVKDHLVEAGAELIGENHPLWFRLAALFRLTLDPLTDYKHARIRFNGHDLTPAEQDSMDAEVATAQVALGRLAWNLSRTEPWLDPRARGWDAQSVTAGLARLTLPRPLSAHAQQWFTFTLGNDNCLPIDRQSFLGLLGSISAARMVADDPGRADDPGMRGYWLSTETHRCRGGNDLLGQRLAGGLRVSVQTNTFVRQVQVQPGLIPPVAVSVEREPSVVRPSRPTVARFDYAILTAPPTVWGVMRIEPEFAPASRTLTHGDAVKFVTRYPTQFWVGQQPPEDKPSAKWDEMGSLWEGTDNQGAGAAPPLTSAPEPPYALSVFSGGQYVCRERDYPAKMAALFPHGRPGPGLHPTLFCDWPTTPFIRTGYAVPAVGEASVVFAAQRQPHAGRLLFAGEQTSSGFFGYMEGALESGARAARDVVDAVAIPCPRVADAYVPGGSHDRGGGGHSGGVGATSDW